MQGHQHGRPDRLEAELLLAAPLQADALAGQAPGDQRRVERGIVGAVVAVAAGAVQMPRGDGLDWQAEHRRQVLAQRMHALAVRPHREMAVAELGQRAGRRHRGVRDVGPRDGDLHQALGRRRRRLRADAPVLAGLALQPRGLLLLGLDAPHIVPRRMQRGGGRGGLGDALDRADEGHEIGFAHDLQFALRGAADRGLVERRQGGAAAGLAQRPGMQQVFRHEVVHESGAAHLRRQVDARHALADHLVGRGGLRRRRPGDRLAEIDLGRDRPVVLAGRRAVLQELSVDHRELVAAAIEPERRPLQRLGAHLGADQPHRAAGHFDRQRRRRVELVGTMGGVARQHGDAIERHVELVGRDLADGGDDALPDLDLAGGDAHGAVGLEADPAVEARILDQAGRQDGRAHAGLPLRSVAAARSTARRMR